MSTHNANCSDLRGRQKYNYTGKPTTEEIVYNEHKDQAEFARYNRYRYIYIRASSKTFNYGI